MGTFWFYAISVKKQYCRQSDRDVNLYKQLLSMRVICKFTSSSFDKVPMLANWMIKWVMATSVIFKYVTMKSWIKWNNSDSINLAIAFVPQQNANKIPEMVYSMPLVSYFGYSSFLHSLPNLWILLCINYFKIIFSF